MTIIGTLLDLGLALGLAYGLGAGLVLTALPEKLRRLTFYIAPTVGYVAFCFISILISGLLHKPLVETNWIALAILSIWTVVALVKFRSELKEMFYASRWLPVIVVVMLIVVFHPILDLGIGHYVGTANPDFFQSLSFQKTLIRTASEYWVKTTDLPLVGPFQGMFPDAFQARFGAVAYSVLIEQISGSASHVALMSSVVAFLICLPLSVYFFSVVVLSLEPMVALLSALLIATSASTTMSFVHTFVGQNSALATIPLCIALIFIALRDRSIAVAALSAIVLNGVFWVYVVVLPYVIAPFGLYGLIKLYKQGIVSIRWWAIGVATVCLLTGIIHIGIYGQTLQLLLDLKSLMGKVASSPYYTEYLTDEIFQYCLGLTSYPLSQSVLANQVAGVLPKLALFLGATTLTGLGIALTVIYLHAVRKWSKTAPGDSIYLVSALLITYFLVWFHYTFFVRYGYAPFKMSVWLQFLAAPFFAWLLLQMAGTTRVEKIKRGNVLQYSMLALIGPVYIGLNIVSTLDYGSKSYGRDIYHGSLINAYGIAGNADYEDLANQLHKIVGKDKSIALGLTDSIQNIWTAYFVDQVHVKSTILSHEVIPFEDAYLPDVRTRQYVDSLGNTLLDEQRYFNDGLADYYLLPGKGNLNTDIVSPMAKGEPVWQNNTFALYEKEKARDITFLGRGFYRLEHLDAEYLDWWWPQTFRWSASGGEIYHLMPSSPGKAYHLEFSVMAGTGVAVGRRTIEVSINGEVIDEVQLSGFARVATKPYFPQEGSNRLVLRVKERPELTPRGAGLWNRDLPLRSTPINVLFSDIKVVHDQDSSPVYLPAGKLIQSKDLFANFQTFNGFDVDGWIRDEAVFSTNIPVGAKKLEIGLLVPDFAEFDFPYAVEFNVNGQRLSKSFPNPGVYNVSLDLPPGSSPALVTAIVPKVAKRIVDGMVQREVLHSVRVMSVKIVSP